MKDLTNKKPESAPIEAVSVQEMVESLAAQHEAAGDAQPVDQAMAGTVISVDELGSDEVDVPVEVAEPEGEAEPVSTDELVWTAKSYNRVDEQSFAEGSTWRNHLIYENGAPRHRIQLRDLPDGRVVARPASYQGDDRVFDDASEIQTA